MSDANPPNDFATETLAEPNPPQSAAPPRRRFVVPLLLFGLILGIAGWFVSVWWNSPDGQLTWERLLSLDDTPPLVKVTGQVLYKGKPVTEGSIVTEYPRNGLFGGLSILDQDGRFELMTQVDGKYHPGAYVGEHVVAVFSFGPSTGGGPPAGLVPSKYLTHRSSPLRMKVTSDPEENVFVFNLEGEREKRRQPPPENKEPESEPEKKAGP